MLTEAFVNSVLSPEGSRKSSSTAKKDGGIYVQSVHATSTVQSNFKKSSTDRNCLAVSETHIYAAQADKAVVHVYSRQRANQEATVPFPERIKSVCFGGYDGGAGLLALGTQGGRVILWEVCTGRQVTTPASHLQPVTALAVDFTLNFVLSGSEDSNIHVWSISSLLSFSGPAGNGLSTSSQTSPWRTLSNHRGPITSVVTGHFKSATNIAVSASKDDTCIVWDYQSGDLLRTFIFSKSPISLALDPCDRAFYAGHEDGTIQLVDFFKPPLSVVEALHQDGASQSMPVQAPASDLWAAASQNLGAALCLDVVYEGNYLLSGHESGKVCLWDVATGKYTKELTDHGTPVTNLVMLPPTGFPTAAAPTVTAHQVLKPRYESSFTTSASGRGSDTVPADYTVTVQFSSELQSESSDTKSDFSLAEAFNHPSLPQSYLAASLTSLTASLSSSSSASPSSTFGNPPITTITTDKAQDDDQNPILLKQQISQLQSDLDDLQATHKQTWKKMVEMRMEKIEREKAEKAARAMDKRRHQQKKMKNQKRKKKKRISDEEGNGLGSSSSSSSCSNSSSSTTSTWENEDSSATDI